MPNFLGVDIGYSNLKAAKTNASNINALKHFVRGDDDASEDIEFSILCRPAGAIEASKMPRNIFKSSDNDDGVAVEIDGVEWRGGVDFTLNSDINRELSDQYIYTPQWKALFYTALSWAEWDTVDTVVLGLPCNEYYQNQAAVDTLKEFAVGSHTIRKGKTVEVKNVIVAPQPIGSLMGYMLSDATPEEEKILKGRVTTLTLDPGFFSFDWVAVQNNGIVQSTAKSSRYSIRDVCSEISGMLAKRFPNSPSLPDGEVEHAIRSKSNSVYAGGTQTDITEEIQEAVRRVTERGLNEIRSNLASNNIEARIVLLSGGGADLFENAMREGLNYDNFMTSDAAVLMNSFGYLRLAIENIDTFS